MESDTLSQFYEGGPHTWEEAFPSACVQPRWGLTTKVVERILPTKNLPPMAFDPRPSVKVCTQYVNPQQAPLQQNEHGLPTTIGQFPPGGSARLGIPNQIFTTLLDKESDLFLLNEDLSRCKERKYIPVNGTPAQATNIVQRTYEPAQNEVHNAQSVCREADDKISAAKSSKLFNNSTRYDRTR